jgi:hypothetical protein
VVIGRAANNATGFDKDALNRSMKMSVPTMGPTTDFKQWATNLFNFLSLKAAYLIPQLAIREWGGMSKHIITPTHCYSMLPTTVSALIRP